MNTALATAMPTHVPAAPRQPWASEVRAIRKKSGPGDSRERKWAAAMKRKSCMESAPAMAMREYAGAGGSLY